MTPENKVKATIIRRLKALAQAGEPIYWEKRHGGAMSVAGLPDFHVILNGLHSDIEIKAPGKRPTPLQVERMEQIRRAGGRAAWCDNVDDFMKFIQGE